MRKGRPYFYYVSVFLPVIVGLICGCSREKEDPLSQALTPVVLQTDWFPQPEHGGFYQALARGFYAEAGLDVIILPGGPNAMSTQKILKGTAHFAMNRADTIYTLSRRDVPVQMVMATLQNDPQALMLHETNPLQSLAELDGQRVMAIPGLAWIKWLEAKYEIQLNIIPHDFGIERFLNDPYFIQQCLLTNEPYYAEEAGTGVKVFPLRDSGFNPYHGIYCLTALIEADPDTVARFVSASIRGWRDFILNDPAPALALIASRNPKMNAEFMAYSYAAMRGNHLVTGPDTSGSSIGQLNPARMDALAREMEQLGLVKGLPVDDDPWYTTRFLPRPADVPGNELP